jgi:hypothetical protein
MAHTPLVFFNYKGNVMNMIEEKLSDIIRENDIETAVKVLYSIMQDCVRAEAVVTTANIYRTVDRLVDINCEQHFA